MSQILVPDADGVLEPHPLGLVERTNEQYHQGPGISKSHLDLIAQSSELHYWHKYLNPEREAEEPTPALVLGSAVHSIILEPDLFTSQYVPNPGIERRSNAGKAEWAAFVEEHKGKTILTDEQYQTCLQVRDAVYRHPVASGLLRQAGQSEQTFYAIDSETGELIKCRLDRLPDSGAMILDVKTTDDASPGGFARSCANFRYPVQSAWYKDVLDAAVGGHPEDFVFIAVEKSPPYAIGVYFVDYTDEQRGRLAARRDLQRIVNAKRANYWPDYGAEIRPLQMPTWWKP
jgi:exodeoxyribonuclease VIII